MYLSEVVAIKEQMLKLPENIKGIEVGLGTGRFTQVLGIKEGVEPANEMAHIIHSPRFKSWAMNYNNDHIKPSPTLSIRQK